MSEVPPRIKNMLYAHSGNECANPSCHAKLVYVEDNAIDSQVCHIEAKSSGGPRYNPNQTEEERNGYENLILLCHKCHEMIDNNPETYTVELLKKWKKEHESKYKTDNKEKVFRTPIPDGLLPRDNEVDKLFDGISNNRIYNLIGVGGSGKSSLAYLMIQKYKDNFNEIAFVVVNSDIKQDIVTQLNRTLKFELKKDLYPEIISHLQENFKSVQPNLLVLDINETASKTDIFVDEVLKDNLFLEGWKFLILSRENVDTRFRIKSRNVEEERGFDFLKELFLKKAGERYDDFGDFETLFNVIFYNPLLVEQLGICLHDDPQPATIDDMKTILFGTSFRKEDMLGMSAKRHNETIISFLKNLIVYNNIKDINEKALLRHFVLWPSDYISYDVIADLLKGVFDSESVLKNVFKILTRRSIVVTTINDDKVLCYKLHGLLAESLRQQIDFEKEDWNGYLDNVERIRKYDYSKFVLYVDCIGKSLCEYNITFNLELLHNVAFKLECVWKADYADILYTIVVNIIKYYLSFDKDNYELQFNLAHAYLDHALIKQDYFGDYEFAKSNFENAIAIGEHLPKDVPEYQSVLAKAYNSLAGWQRYNLNDYELSKSTIEKTIAIYERLSKDNSKYQSSLAMAYCNLAIIQKCLGDYESAKFNFENVIAISEHLPKDNFEGLPRTYLNLAHLQGEHLEDYESAKSNYENAIAICERLPKESPECQYLLAMAYIGLADLQREHFGDYKSAISNYENAIAIGEHLPKDNLKVNSDFAMAYNGLAVLQMNIKKFADAESNVYFAINIYKQLEKNTPKYLIYRLNSEDGLAEIFLSNGKAEKAKEILDRIQPLAKKCLAENPNDNFTIEVNKEIDKLVEKCSKILSKEK